MLVKLQNNLLRLNLRGELEKSAPHVSTASQLPITAKDFAKKTFVAHKSADVALGIAYSVTSQNDNQNGRGYRPSIDKSVDHDAPCSVIQPSAVAPCDWAKWASPSTAAIQSSCESTSAPTNEWPAGALISDLISEPIRPRLGLEAYAHAHA
jgi:hypothetical protein